MRKQKKRRRGAFSSILCIALAFQLYAIQDARGQFYDGGATYEVTEDSAYAYIHGEGTVVNLHATVTNGIYVCYFGAPGATLNFFDDARAGLIYADTGSYVNIYGGLVDVFVSVSEGTEVTIYGEQFVVVDPLTGTQEYDPGTKLYTANAVLTAYDAWGDVLFTGRISCVEGAYVSLASESGNEELDVQIDVKPGDNSNIINPRSNGKVAVAVLSDGTFDATQVLPETVYFAGAGVAKNDKGKYMAHAEDIDEDGNDDMVFHFQTSELELEGGVITLTLTGQLGGSQMAVESAGQVNDGTVISGTDNVQVLQSKSKKK
ncbi:MAG: hypothetical protein ACYSWW_14735 [Planctomycetota bacterium]|jgi:hypothetical protein